VRPAHAANTYLASANTESILLAGGGGLVAGDRVVTAGR
jgi:urease accessory protein UreH